MWFPFSLLWKEEKQRSRHLSVGEEGEDTAVRYLRSCAYRVLARNVRVGRRDEIDVIAYDEREQCVVFVEVKSRSHVDGEYQPEMSFTFKKRRKLQRAVRRWIAGRDYPGGYRIDLVCVAGGRVVNHVREVAWV